STSCAAGEFPISPVDCTNQHGTAVNNSCCRLPPNTTPTASCANGTPMTRNACMAAGGGVQGQYGTTTQVCCFVNPSATRAPVTSGTPCTGPGDQICGTLQCVCQKAGDCSCVARITPSPT